MAPAFRRRRPEPEPPPPPPPSLPAPETAEARAEALRRAVAVAVPGGVEELRADRPWVDGPDDGDARDVAAFAPGQVVFVLGLSATLAARRPDVVERLVDDLAGAPGVLRCFRSAPEQLRVYAGDALDTRALTARAEAFVAARVFRPS